MKTKLLRILSVYIVALINVYSQGCETQCLFRTENATCLLPIEFRIMMERFTQLFRARCSFENNVMVLGGATGSYQLFLAREFAKQTGSQHFVVNATSFLKAGIVGGGVAAIIRAFDDALSYIALHGTRVVLIFEEIDSIANHENNDLNGEIMRACMTFNSQADQRQDNTKLMVICTTNNYMNCTRDFRSRYVYIPINQYAINEKKNIFMRPLIDDTIDFIHQKYTVVCKNYREPLNILKDTVAILFERIRSSKRSSFQEFDLERAKLDILRCRKALTDIALDQAKKDYLNIINELEELVVACERAESDHAKLMIFAQLSMDVDRLGDRYTSEVYQVADRLFELVSQVIKIDKTVQNIQGISALESSIRQDKKFFATLQNPELKEVCYEFLEDLGVFIKMYDLIFDPDRINLLAEGIDARSMRSINKLVSDIRNIALTRNLDKKTLELIKFLQKVDEPAERSELRSKALDLLEKIGVPMANLVIVSLIMMAPIYLKKTKQDQKGFSGRACQNDSCCDERDPSVKIVTSC